MYDYRGEVFGYLQGGKLYDLEGQLAGTVTERGVFALDGTLIWHRDRDGLYDQHWVSIGYIGSESKADDEYDD
ncbi:MAG: hypothetical protein HC915_15680 [Anaerolineae bacterium]|nr:hypothetical protein [Anaerolineae bacterium]